MNNKENFKITDPELLNTVNLVLRAIEKDRSLLNKTFKTMDESQQINAENLSDLAGNHLFDNNPKLFSISKGQGHTLRAYLSTPLVQYIVQLHTTFPDIMDPERRRYLEKSMKYVKESYKVEMQNLLENAVDIEEE